MNRYDRGWGRGYGQGMRGYDRGFISDRDEMYAWDAQWGRAPDAGFWPQGAGLYRRWGTPWEAGGSREYDRGVYGGGHPGYGGYPGGDRGIHYGGRGGYDRGYGRAARQGYGGWDRGRGGYGGDFVREPFMPEEAYRRHPEYNRPQRHLSDRWPEEDHGAAEADLDDDEVLQGVRESLYQDNWIDADRIQVEVAGGVVTLRGEVDDFLEARYAWDDAWESPGVRGVVNNLHVRIDQPAGMHDSMLQTEGGAAQEKGRGKRR